MTSLWGNCVEILRCKLNKHAMSTWIEPVLCEEVSEGKIRLIVPNNFFVMWIKDRYLELIKETIASITGIFYEIEFLSRDAPSEADSDYREDFGKPITRNSIERPSIISALSETESLKLNLNPRYSFDSFVVGPCNQFARAAALSVSENLGGSYNPLFLYGGVGLGKTHLMSAIGHSVLSKDRTKRVSFCSSEEFTNEMINAIRYDKMSDFRQKYRNLDLLMIDDIQFIAGKERTQEEFFHTFNSIYEARNQLVITSDRFPNAITDMEHRLRSRFNWGLVADMGVPDLETKVAILKRKAFEDSVDLPDDVAYFLAENVESNVRELVGYLIRVIAMSTLQGMPICKDLAQMALKELLHRHNKKITVDDIIASVSKSFNVKASDIKSKKKHKIYSLPRQVGMYLARELTDLSYPEIGAAFGGKDHSTVIYGTRKIEQQLEKDNSMKSMIERIKDNLKK
jgi:chromosomal replication initiator protein